MLHNVQRFKKITLKFFCNFRWERRSLALNCDLDSGYYLYHILLLYCHYDNSTSGAFLNHKIQIFKKVMAKKKN